MNPAKEGKPKRRMSKEEKEEAKKEKKEKNANKDITGTGRKDGKKRGIGGVISYLLVPFSARKRKLPREWIYAYTFSAQSTTMTSVRPRGREEKKERRKEGKTK